VYPSPRLVYWELTKRCNLRCVHCRAVPETAPSPDELSLPDAMGVIDTIAEYGRPILVFTGGEPLLCKNLFVLAQHAQSHGLTIALATNGTLVTRQAARIASAGFRRVSISLDGPDAGTHDRFRRVDGAFDRAVDGFLHLKALGVSLQVNTTVTVHNRERLDDIYELVRTLGADAWHLFLLVPVGCGLELTPTAQLTPREYEQVLYWIDELAEREAQQGRMEVRATCAPHAQRVRLQRLAVAGGQVEAKVKVERAGKKLDLLFPQPQPEPQPVSQTRRGCLAGSGICFISHKGEVFPCGYLPVQAGDIRRQSFAEIWNKAPIFADLREPDRLMGKCGVCEYRVVCGGCRARAFGQSGHPLHEEPFCNYLPASANSR
jgi:radical SAM protein with 4Fe4S-binding SPASM domain